MTGKNSSCESKASDCPKDSVCFDKACWCKINFIAVEVNVSKKSKGWTQFKTFQFRTPENAFHSLNLEKIVKRTFIVSWAMEQDPLVAIIFVHAT